jgi:hypothetical protein
MSLASGPVSTDIGDDYFSVLVGTDLDFPSAVSELVDNALSSATKRWRCTFHVVVELTRRNNDDLEVTVVDDGLGIPRSNIADGVFRPAGRTASRGQCYGDLREHGLGLKHSLAWLSQNRGLQFRLSSAFLSSTGKPEYTMVDGPLRRGLTWRDGTPTEWLRDGAVPKGSRNTETGTRVWVATSFAQAASGWQDRFEVSPVSIPDLESLASYLSETFGVLYRHFLTIKKAGGLSNSIRVKWDDISTTKSGELEVRPVPIPYLASPQRIALHTPSGKLTAEYTRGISDPDKAAKNLLFYQHSQPNQGIDIVVRGKVVRAAAYLWPGRVNPEQNGLVGELIVRGPGVKTVVTKNQVNWSDTNLALLHEIILAADRNPSGPRRGRVATGSKPLYDFLLSRLDLNHFKGRKPSRQSKNLLLEYDRKVGLRDNRLRQTVGLAPILKARPAPVSYKVELGETDLRNVLLKALNANCASGVGAKEVKAWDKRFTGSFDLPEDLTFEEPGRRLFILECKKDEAKPLDLYQLILYWDGFATARGAGKGPIRGFLVADSFPTPVRYLANYISANRKDQHSQPYDIRTVMWRSLGIDKFGPTKRINNAIRRFIRRSLI